MSIAETQAKIDDLHKRIAEHMVAIAALRADLRPMEQAVACARSGFNIGDTVEWAYIRHASKGTSKGVIQSVHGANGGIRLTVRRILKDGRFGVLVKVYGYDSPCVIERAK